MELEVTCDWCGKEFDREVRRINEAGSRDWKQYCSPECLRKSKLNGKDLICDNSECNKKFYRPKRDFDIATRHFCSHSCRARVLNLEKGIKNMKKCLNSDCKEKVLSFKKFCSNECFQQYRKINFNPHYKERVLSAIKQFVKENDRIPFKQEMMKFYHPARFVFGTWNKAVEAAGFTPNQLKFTHKYSANDGHICDSLAEKIIDDWLTARKIKHLFHEAYPYAGNFKSDFKVGDYWIEFFGLAGQHKRYDELKTEKLRIIKKNKLHLISIYPKDLFPKSKLNQLLSCLLAN
ncbi:MAG TPA: hypothetical protein VJ242_03560 [Patescibacteria group bacterium]|nr:hypothetical protein [Patescibacteria group bacterium]